MAHPWVQRVVQTLLLHNAVPSPHPFPGQLFSMLNVEQGGRTQLTPLLFMGKPPGAISAHDNALPPGCKYT